jgi:hypothetical protein
LLARHRRRRARARARADTPTRNPSNRRCPPPPPSSRPPLQVTFFLTYLWVVGLYIYSLVLNKRRIGFRALKAHLSDCSLDELGGGAGAPTAAAAAAGGGSGGAGGAAAGAAGAAGAAAGSAGAASGESNGGHRAGKHQAGAQQQQQQQHDQGEGRPLLPVRSEGGGGNSGGILKGNGGNEQQPGGGPAGAGGSGGDPNIATSSPFSSAAATTGSNVAAFARELADAPLARLVLRGDARVVADSEAVLRDCVEFGALLLWLFLCDRTPLLPGAEKTYSRDLFLFVFGTLVAVAGTCSLSPPGRSPLLLNRPQTEEWKGWMQVLFLLYHYFEAREFYNAIRIFIAGYVWMTGFGNFSYYYKTGDFSVGRFAQMMWRLNFLVFFCCLVLDNSYMLYYICPMHTIFTVLVYGVLAVAPRLNKVDACVWAKVAASFALVFVFWDLQPVFYAVWRPFGSLVTYVDPRKPRDKQDPMHGEEWPLRDARRRCGSGWGGFFLALSPTRQPRQTPPNPALNPPPEKKTKNKKNPPPNHQKQSGSSARRSTATSGSTA